MLIFQFFFTDYDGEEVLPTQNQYASIDEIIEIMQSVLIRPENFLGIVDKNDRTLQFIVNDDYSLDADIPVPDQKGSYTKTISLHEAVKLVQRQTELIQIDAIEGKEWLL
ncbi:hypothetical protein [Acinetobacter guillouiae]|uniref:Uncharacterized protein n=1 Tax=Acinetobacter guillouiae NIPH 991 TaxID=1217656 RepID=N8YFI3_ACIGI|nr:hypothetical protein [Acinetobacter guillouiae]ENV18418.1 hypothetical protein F964_00915 [Acinetobacter guillouiae NIPH 991]